MLLALLPFLEAIIDESPAILTALSELLNRKQQQYASVVSAVSAETADNAERLRLSKPVSP